MFLSFDFCVSGTTATRFHYVGIYALTSSLLVAYYGYYLQIDCYKKERLTYVDHLYAP